MTVNEYAEKVSVTQSAVSYRMRNDLPLPGIKTYAFDMGLKKYILCPERSPNWEKCAKLFRQKC